MTPENTKNKPNKTLFHARLLPVLISESSLARQLYVLYRKESANKCYRNTVYRIPHTAYRIPHTAELDDTAIPHVKIKIT